MDLGLFASFYARYYYPYSTRLDFDIQYAVRILQNQGNEDYLDLQIYVW